MRAQIFQDQIRCLSLHEKISAQIDQQFIFRKETALDGMLCEGFQAHDRQFPVADTVDLSGCLGQPVHPDQQFRQLQALFSPDAAVADTGKQFLFSRLTPSDRGIDDRFGKLSPECLCQAALVIQFLPQQTDIRL